MDIRTIERNGHLIAIVDSETPLVTDAQSALDLFATIGYVHEATRIALRKEALVERFFDLSSRLAGEVLQKVVNYQLKLAIYGDFSVYPSKALKAFILESNAGSSVFFVSDIERAIERLSW